MHMSEVWVYYEHWTKLPFSLLPLRCYLAGLKALPCRSEFTSLLKMWGNKRKCTYFVMRICLYFIYERIRCCVGFQIFPSFISLNCLNFVKTAAFKPLSFNHSCTLFSIKCFVSNIVFLVSGVKCEVHRWILKRIFNYWATKTWFRALHLQKNPANKSK